MDRHDSITETIGRWLGELGFKWKMEQMATEYETPEHRARLDLWYADAQWGHTWIDVSLCASHAHDGVSVKQRFLRREQAKHARYRGGSLVPFVLDPRGSWGREALAWMQHIAGQAQTHNAGL